MNPWLKNQNWQILRFLLLLLLARWIPFLSLFRISNLQKNCHQDNLSIVCLQRYQNNCQNILAGIISFRIQVKDQYEMAVIDSHSIPSSGSFNPNLGWEGVIL